MRAKSGPGVEVRLESILKTYGDARAVDRVSITIPSGQLVTLLGPSGSGKTTSLMILAGFTTPDSGEVYIDDVRITEMPAHRRAIGMVFQHYALFPHMTVFQNIAYPLKMRRVEKSEIRARVATALELVQLPDVAERYPRQLSGGQQQRIALARAIVFEPQVLLMDEPLGALDKKLREQMQVELRSLQQNLGITTLYVTHDQEEAMALSDVIAVMRNGVIEQSGKPGQIYEHPANAFIAGFLGTSNLMEGRLESTPQGNLDFVSSRGLRFAVDPAMSKRVESDVQILIRPERIRWVEANEMDVSLEVLVVTATYLGERFRYGVRLSDGTDIVVTQTNIPGALTYPPGATARLGWNHNDVIIL